MVLGRSSSFITVLGEKMCSPLHSLKEAPPISMVFRRPAWEHLFCSREIRVPTKT